MYQWPPKPRPLAEIEAKYADDRAKGRRIRDRYTVECRRNWFGLKTYYLYDHVRGESLRVGQSYSVDVTEEERSYLAQLWVASRW